MEVAASHHAQVTVLAIAGSVDSRTADQLTASLNEQIGAGLRCVSAFGALANSRPTSP